jgi:hypothetical protein
MYVLRPGVPSFDPHGNKVEALDVQDQPNVAWIRKMIKHNLGIGRLSALLARGRVFQHSMER